MPQLVAICYPDEVLAGRAAEEFGRCAGDLGIDPDAASTVVCERDGSCRLTTSRRPGTTANWSRFWAVLLGVVVNGGEGGEIDPRFRASLEARLRPGTSVLLAALSRAFSRRALDNLTPYGGRLLSCEISDEVRARWEGREITRSG